ncbi:MAG: hypothetical protein RL329_3972 [Bacteroidota bacterium]
MDYEEEFVGDEHELERSYGMTKYGKKKSAASLNLPHVFPRLRIFNINRILNPMCGKFQTVIIINAGQFPHFPTP